MTATAPAAGPAADLAALRAQAWRGLVAARPPDWVLRHSRAVETLAAAMCDAAEGQGLEPDRRVVQPGALLHDIGRSQVQDLRHASVGAALLRGDSANRADGGAVPWDPRVVQAVERHTGAGVELEEAVRFGLPAKDYTPKSLEERIVAHADNLYSGDGRLTMAELKAKYLAKGLEKPWEKIERLHRSLCDELGADLERLGPARLSDP